MDAQDIKQLKKKVENAKIELAKAEERQKRAKQDMKGILEELKKAGCTADNISEKISELEKEIKKIVASITKKLDKAESIKDSSDSVEDEPDGPDQEDEVEDADIDDLLGDLE